MIGLGLSGCASNNPTPAYIQHPDGNAWVIELPKDSQVIVKNPKDLIPAVNEISEDGILKENCVMVSKSYLNRRDANEVELLKIIEELKIKLKAK